MLYPPAITDDAEFVADDSSGDEIDQCVKVRKKKKNRSLHSDFADSFVFDVSAANEKKDVASVKRYLKTSVASTLEEKIEKERAALSFCGALLGGDDPDCELVQEMEHLSDSVREKKARKAKKLAVEDFFDERAAENALASDAVLSFSQMGLSRPLLKAVGECGYSEPTRIQATCIPLALTGRDICACAATGTGKTAAFMLPILERLLYKPKQRSLTRALVLVPTRELAIQVFQVSRMLSQFSQVEICLCAGGLDIKAQEAALRLGPDIVVATPGRLIDHLHNAPVFTLHDVEVLVLDEADRMLDEAFADQMKELIRLCSKKRQTMLFSATMTDKIEDLASVSLNNPVKLFINENTETALNLRQEFIRVRENREGDRESIIAALVTRTFPDRTIVFAQTKKICQRLQIVLGLLGVKVGQLHSGLTQAQRVETLSRFKKAELDVLISTDLASRGLDIEGVTTVINMQMPVSLKQYVHRVGRTARAGRVGRSVSLVGEGERKILKEIVVANSDNSLKQRLISADVIEAYGKRIEGLKESIEKVEEEERAERALRLADVELRRGEAKLQNITQKREWFKGDSERTLKEAHAKSGKKKKLVNATASGPASEEEGRMQRLADFQAREAKRARKGKRIRSVVDDVPDSRAVASKKRRSKSSFTKQLTSVGRKAVKRFRHGPSDAEFKSAKVRRLAGRSK